MNECENRLAIVDGKKCFCAIWERWTNCLEVGHCVRESVTDVQTTKSEDEE